MTEGFWTVQFTGVQGLGAGVVTFMNGQVFGGDSGFRYTGTYNEQGKSLTAQIRIEQHTDTGRGNVMGIAGSFNLDLSGTQQGSTVMVAGNMPNTTLKFSAVLTKVMDLPKAGSKAATR